MESETAQRAVCGALKSSSHFIECPLVTITRLARGRPVLRCQPACGPFAQVLCEWPAGIHAGGNPLVARGGPSSAGRPSPGLYPRRSIRITGKAVQWLPFRDRTGSGLQPLYADRMSGGAGPTRRGHALKSGTFAAQLDPHGHTQAAFAGSARSPPARSADPGGTARSWPPVLFDARQPDLGVLLFQAGYLTLDAAVFPALTFPTAQCRQPVPNPWGNGTRTRHRDGWSIRPHSPPGRYSGRDDLLRQDADALHHVVDSCMATVLTTGPAGTGQKSAIHTM